MGEKMKTTAILTISGAVAAVFAAAFSAASAEPAFYAAARAADVEILSHSFPLVFAPGLAEMSMAVSNLGDSALRGTLSLETCESGGKAQRRLAVAEIDLPPPMVTDAEQELSLAATITEAEVGRTAMIVLHLPFGNDVICLSGRVEKSAAGAARRAEDAKSATSAAGGRHEIRFVEAMPAGEGEGYRAFLEAGGVLIIPKVAAAEDFAGAADFCGEKFLPAFKPQKGPANRRDRFVKPGATPLFDWPNRISPSLLPEDGRIAGAGEASKIWECVQEGYTWLLRVGKGMLVVSSHSVEDTAELREDIARHLELEEGGFRLVELLHQYSALESYKGTRPFPDIGGGKTVVKVRNANFATTNLNLAARLTIREKREGGESRTFVARARENKKVGDVITIEIVVPPLDLNGECTARTEILDWSGGRAWTLDECDVALPEFFEVVPPANGGRVSTRRRESDVFAGVAFRRAYLDAGGGKWRLSARDASGATVAEVDGVFLPGASSAEARLPVPPDAPAGRYTLAASADLPGGGSFSATGSFEIVAPKKGQIMADQDGFWLQEGEPFFPLGTYHCLTSELFRPIDETGLRACDMGFNWMQIWDWDWRAGICLDREILARAIGKNLSGEELEAAIDRRIATNKVNRAALKGVALCLEGYGVWDDCINEQPGWFGKYTFERREDLPQEVAAIVNDPDLPVRMWYCADEASGNYHWALSRVARRYEECSAPRRFPAFNLGNVPAVMAGDLGGNDIYVRYYGGLGSAATFANRLDSIRRDLAPFRRRPFIVPQAFGQSPRQSSETPEWVRVETYLCCIHGAAGIGYYCWKQTGDWTGVERQGMGWNPPTAHEVKKLIAEVKTFQAALMSGESLLLKSSDGNVHALLCGDAATGRYLIAANTLEGEVETSIRMNGTGDLALEPLFDSPQARFRGDALQIRLPAWGTAAWKVNN